MGMAARSMTMKDSLIAAAYAGRVEALPEPAFDYSIGWATDYSKLFRGEIFERGDINGLLRTATSSGRVLLCGRGGSGKTTVLRRIAIAAADLKMAVLFVDLRKWSATDEAAWHMLSSEATPRMDFLLGRFSDGPASVLELDWLSPNDGKLFILDGLNEVPFDYGNEIIAAADEIVALLINASVIASDRLVRRPIRAKRWRFALVESLNQNSIRKAWSDANRNISALDGASASQKALLNSPFFLDEAIKDGLSGATRVASLRKFFTKHASLSDPELLSAAQAAYFAYSKYRARTFLLADFERIAGSTVVEKLLQSNVLISEVHRSYFRHHLHHDFLASKHLAENPTIWNHDAFNVVTLNASSFDAIGLALGQVGTSRADQFVRKIYDWNPYAAAYALSPEEGQIEALISREMEHAILCMLAERRWDPILATVQRTEDALSVIPTPDARLYLSALSLREVVEIVSSVQSSVKWFERWRALFTHLSGPASPDEVSLISDVDGILGWTVANVLKRLRLAPAQQRDLRAKANNEAVAVRWRVAHVLGAFPSQANFRLLRTFLADDADEWVRYGAIRSLVEMAARAQNDLRQSIFGFLAKNVRLLRSRPRVLDEFARAVVVRPEVAPHGWTAAVELVIDRLLDHSANVSELDRWARLSANLREIYGSD